MIHIGKITKEDDYAETVFYNAENKKFFSVLLKKGKVLLCKDVKEDHKVYSLLKEEIMQIENKCRLKLLFGTYVEQDKCRYFYHEIATEKKNLEVFYESKT